MNLENLQQALEIALIALGRIPDKDLRQAIESKDLTRILIPIFKEDEDIKQAINGMNINDFIAMNTPGKVIADMINIRIGGPDYAEMYTYLRDEFQCKTVAEGAEMIRQGKVPRDVIIRWVDSKYCVNDREYRAIEQGYPDLKERLVTAKKQYWEELIKNNS